MDVGSLFLLLLSIATKKLSPSAAKAKGSRFSSSPTSFMFRFPAKNGTQRSGEVKGKKGTPTPTAVIFFFGGSKSISGPGCDSGPFFPEKRCFQNWEKEERGNGALFPEGSQISTNTFLA